MKPSAGKAWEGFLASLLLHLALAAVVLHGMTPGPAPGMPVIDLSLLPTADGGSPGNSPGPARNAPRVDDAAPAPASARPPIPEETADAPSAPAPSAVVPAAGAPGRSASPARPPSPAPFPAGDGPASLSAAPSSSGGRGASPPRRYDHLREAIQREISYPVVARRMGWEGRVVVAFVILPDGGVRDVRVVRGSGFPVLDRSAVEAVRSASPFPHPPAETEVLAPVVYRLDENPR